MSKSERLKAAQKGEIKYLGTICKRGHDSLRYTKTGGCIECYRLANKTSTENIRKLLAEAKK